MKRIVLFTLVISLSAVQAEAAMWVTLNDGVAPVMTIGDNIGLDTDPTVGIISFSTAIGAVWNVNITTGVSKPVLGGPTIAKIHLDSINISGGAGTLTIGLTDTGFTLPAPIAANAVLISEFGGVTEGTVKLTQTLDPDDLEFATPADGDEVVLVSPVIGWLGPGSFSDSQAAPSPVVAMVPFSLTEMVVINHTAAGQSTSFDAVSTVVPVPAAVLLGILGLGVAGIKLRKYA